MNDFVRPESMEVPEGGLASFLTATVGEWADEDVSPKGIASLETVADKLAEYGRYEDTYMVHAAQGETVIPMAVFDENPRLKASLFSQMRAMGIDPEQYVVGNELNSINPVTGQPEFFLKKLFKGLKKAVKKVIKVVKKVAPIALSYWFKFCSRHRSYSWFCFRQRHRYFNTRWKFKRCAQDGCYWWIDRGII